MTNNSTSLSKSVIMAIIQQTQAICSVFSIALNVTPSQSFTQLNFSITKYEPVRSPSTILFLSAFDVLGSTHTHTHTYISNCQSLLVVEILGFIWIKNLMKRKKMKTIDDRILLNS